MKTITRRQFLGTGTMGILAAMYLPSDAPGNTANPFNWLLR